MATVATAQSEWIYEICRRFTENTGWPLVYTPVDAVEAVLLESKLHHAPESCWRTELNDGQRCAGFLHFDLPADKSADRNFPVVREMAEIIGELFGRYLTAAHQLDSRTKEFSTLVSIGRVVPSEEDLLTALRQLLGAAVELTEFRGGAFFLLNPTTNQLKLRLTEQLKPEDIPFPVRDLKANPPDLEALTGGKSLVRRTPSSALWLPDGAAVGLCLAVQSDAGPIGTLWVVDRRNRMPDERELQVLESIAAQIASVLERTVLLKESANQQRLRRDLEVASENQSGDIYSSLSANPGFEVAAICTSRYELGGDLLELISLDEKHSLVAIGDASGDSVPAAMVMSAVRGAMRALTLAAGHDILQTDVVLAQLNEVLYGMTPSHQFMSLFLGVFDSDAGTLTYSNAGHPVPILFKGGETQNLKSHGMLLGVLDDSTYRRSILHLNEGDVLVLFSDGISEAMNRRRKMFRSNGIQTAVEAHLDEPPTAILKAIWDDLEDHLAGDLPDDRTLAVLRVGR